MSPRKLTESDKQEILTLYRMPQETTSTLADRFQVSSSTISRFLKSNLAEDEYEDLIQQKRLSRTPTGAAQVMSLYEQQQDPEESENEDHPETEAIPTPSGNLTLRLKEELDSNLTEETDKPLRSRPILTRSKTESPSDRPSESQPHQLELLSERPLESDFELIPSESADQRKPKPIPKKKITVGSLVSGEDYFELDDDENDVHTLEEMLGEDIGDLDDEDEDLDDYDEDDWDEDDDEPTIPHTHGDKVNVLPLSEAAFPRTCYLVIDRSGELITRPLEEFRDLGNIPLDEVQQETLPVFDNHRVARRFSKRSQRVIKVPDGSLFQKTQPHLQAKGITRLLLDGQVYSLGLN
ncbi:hypothetical protein K4A83_09655 [Spirulina subsalsa FACHB-351]|uniref:Transposase n=1 Tax=Spirulina subsalsa FACHB-351 TaxID=234711 RepID=A0ABT3L4S9_9CYAN|nr:hypothetical protein [Spirulina subsalsa]MCW6036528.1 hypothetical protein [Spirulina subsalsa FACHB-351]